MSCWLGTVIANPWLCYAYFVAASYKREVSLPHLILPIHTEYMVEM
jgi:hypothetical protein